MMIHPNAKQNDRNTVPKQTQGTIPNLVIPNVPVTIQSHHNTQLPVPVGLSLPHHDSSGHLLRLFDIVA